MSRHSRRNAKDRETARERLERFSRDGPDRLYTLFYRALGDATRARDLVQDTLMDATRHLSTYDPSRSFRGWIYRLGQNRLRNFLRRRRLEQSLLQPLAGTETTHEPAPDDALSQGEQQQLLERNIFALPYRQRIAILLRYQEGLSCAEIGSILGLTANAVSIQLHHARRALRAALGARLIGGRP